MAEPATPWRLIQITPAESTDTGPAALREIARFAAALETFSLDLGRFPTTAEGLQALLEPPASNAEGWKGPYLRQVPKDPWGSDYRYKHPAQGSQRDYDVYSVGPDRVEGTADDIAK
jgi:general secretion pathway protein G